MQALDEQLICREYQETNLGIEALTTRYHVGKLKIKKILADNNIPLKKKGGQITNTTPKAIQDYHEEKYKPIPDHYYIAVDRETGFTTNDYMNKGGILTTYIKEHYSQETTLYERRKYYMETGDYWWEQFFEIKSVPNDEVKDCPYCDWTTTDLENKSGMFLTHLKKVHGIDRDRYLAEHPEDREYFTYSDLCKQREFETNKDNYVVCKICGKKLDRIGTSHLKKHGITRQEYIERFGGDDMVSLKFHNKQSRAAIQSNIGREFHHHSAPENEIREFIQSLGFEAKSNTRILNGQEIDIYIPEKHLGIEYNGNLFHSEGYNNVTPNYHYNKMIGCLNKDVRLIMIFEDEYQLHKELVLSKLSHVLGKDNDKERIYARKGCSVKPISRVEAKEFLTVNHIQGFINSTVYLGCYHNNILIGVMTLREETEGCWNLTRFATDYTKVCCGIGGKIFSYFKEHYNYKEIKTFADRRWSSSTEDNLYTKLGFKFDSYVDPTYTYFNSSVDRYKRFHKFLFRKNILLRKYPQLTPEMTEHEMTTALGYRRIWDCGLIKYVYKNVSK